MEPLESDTQFTRSLLLVLEDAQRIERFVAEPYKSDDRGKRSAMLTLRNRMRQVVGDLEAAIVAARRIG